jgi:hypothetical protein
MTPYEQGFAAKCAELQVNPGALLKRARDWGLSNDRLERAGTTTSTATMTLLGALLGRRRGAGGAAAGAVSGLVGGLLGAGGGKVTGALTPLRTKAEQQAHDQSLHLLKSLLIPGVAKYNATKRLERVRAHQWS